MPVVWDGLLSVGHGDQFAGPRTNVSRKHVGRDNSWFGCTYCRRSPGGDFNKEAIHLSPEGALDAGVAWSLVDVGEIDQKPTLLGSAQHKTNLTY